MTNLVATRSNQRHSCDTRVIPTVFSNLCIVTNVLVWVKTFVVDLVIFGILGKTRGILAKPDSNLAHSCDSRLLPD